MDKAIRTAVKSESNVLATIPDYDIVVEYKGDVGADQFLCKICRCIIDSNEVSISVKKKKKRIAFQNKLTSL